MDFYISYWRDRPAFSRAYLTELPSAGDRATAQRERAYVLWRALFEALGARARDEQPELPPLSPLAPRVIVVAMVELLAEEVRAGRLDRLGDLRDELLRFVLRLLANDAVADAHVPPRVAGRRS